MKILKFGGKSLASEDTFSKVIQIISNQSKDSAIVVVVSAIGSTTDTLEHLIDLAKNNQNYQEAFTSFKESPQHAGLDLDTEFNLLAKLYEGVALLEDCTLKIKDLILSQGEIISSKIITKHLQDAKLYAQAVDSRAFIKTDETFSEAVVDLELSESLTQEFFQNFDPKNIAVVTGFIGSTSKQQTTTLGRNGSNYTAALLANFLRAEELQNYTHVDGIFTANPDWVADARKIEELHYQEANELANFGASILHAKTIIPLLEHQIPLRILNTLKPNDSGTRISGKPTATGIKSLCLQSDLSLIQFQGRGLLGIVGVDARVFTALAQQNISIGVISQGSSERGLGFTVHQSQALKAKATLEKEFLKERYTKDVSSITIVPEVAILSIVGQDLNTFDKPYTALIKNKITPILFNNAITGKNVSILIEKHQAQKALQVVHSQIFGVSKTVHLAIFGHGLVGGTLLSQIQATKKSIAAKKNIRLQVFAIGNSKTVVLNENGLEQFGSDYLKQHGKPYTIQDVIDFAKANHLENLIAIDNTASKDFVWNYIPLIKSGFDLISSNKIANTLSYDFYKDLRDSLQENHKEYLYETNVGAGLPVIDTIKLLHLSGENITKIKGVFSGSLSYIFNTFSVQDLPFSQVLKQAIENGYTEPDPREDLSGNDVARKLLILARELDLQNELDSIKVQNLIPELFKPLPTSEFLESLEALDPYFDKIKSNLAPDTVLRYVAELSGDLQKDKGILQTSLINVPLNSALGQLQGSDSLIEIYTESYGEKPIIIQGAGAGAAVTARGVFGDILRLADK